jgi:hypothetical protein
MALVRTNISEVCITSVIMVQRIIELGTTLAVAWLTSQTTASFTSFIESAPFLQLLLAHRATDSIILDVSSALKFDITPGADESYKYHKASLSWGRRVIQVP